MRHVPIALLAAGAAAATYGVAQLHGAAGWIVGGVIGAVTGLLYDFEA